MTEALHQLVDLGKYLFDKRYASGSAGNLSIRLDDEIIIATPTNSSLGNLDPDNLSVLHINGDIIQGDRPSKEFPFHQTIYKNSPFRAVIHLHSTYLTALSCLADLNPENVFKPFTPYIVMKAGKVPLIPYYKPGSPMIAEEIEKLVREHKVFLLANHGVVVAGNSIQDALNVFEEAEESAKLFWILKDENIRYLTDEEVDALLPGRA